MELPCTYIYMKFGEKTLYTCLVSSIDIKIESQIIIKNFKGEHLKNMRHKNVEGIWFEDTTIEFLPKGIKKIFNNLKALGVVNCGLKEISRQDLIGLESLTNIYIHANLINSLPNDLFQHMRRLKEISIIQNKNLKCLSSKLLEPLLGNGLNYVDFEGNATINSFYWPDICGSEETLKDLMELIDECCEDPSPAIEDSAVLKNHPKQEESPMEIDQEISIKSETSSKVVQVLPSLVKCINIAHLDDITERPDIFLSTGSVLFAAHKSVLRASSSYFDNLMRNSPERSILKVQFSEDTVEAFLSCIYSGDPPKHEQTVDLFKMTSVCKVNKIIQQCEEIIMQSLNNSSAYKIYLLAVRYNSTNLADAALNLIKKMHPELNFPGEVDLIKRTVKKLNAGLKKSEV